MEPFHKDYSDYYNLLYHDKNYLLEVDYIEKLFKKYSKRKISKLLNLGCGTGNHDFIFAKKGYEITGIDISNTMVKVANQNKQPAQSNPLFFQGDVRDIRLNKKFDSVAALFHVMSYQNSNQDVMNTFNTAKIHLKKNGLFIFDCWHGPAVLSEKPSVKIKRINKGDQSLIRIAEPQIHFESNVVDVNYEIILFSSINPDFKKINETHKMRYFFFPEIELFAKNAGFKIRASFEWLKLISPTEKSWSVTYILE